MRNSNNSYFKCRKYVMDIQKYLKIMYRPKIFFGLAHANKDKKFIEYVREFEKLRDEKEKILNSDKTKFEFKANGLFLHGEEVPKKYRKYGVVIVQKDSVGTLAHELRHAKQYQDNRNCFNRNKFKEKCYNLIYFFYPTETSAFISAFFYLLHAKLYKESLDYLYIIIKATFINSLIVPIAIFVLVVILALMFIIS